MRAPLAPPRLSDPRKVEAEAQAVATSSDSDRPEAEDLRLQVGDIRSIDQRVIDGRDRVLPDQVFGRHLIAKIQRLWPHIAVGQFEPCAGIGIGELFRVLVEVARDFLISRVHLHRHIRRGHDDRHLLGGVFRIGSHVLFLQVLGRPLLRTGRALGQDPSHI